MSKGLLSKEKLEANCPAEVIQVIKEAREFAEDYKENFAAAFKDKQSEELTIVQFIDEFFLETYESHLGFEGSNKQRRMLYEFKKYYISGGELHQELIDFKNKKEG